MQLEIKGKGIDTGASLREHINDALQNIVEKYFGDAPDGHVSISKDGSRYKADIQIHISKRVMVRASGVSHEIYAAVDEAIEHIAKRLRRNKRRLKEDKGRKEHVLAPAQYYVLPPFSPDAESSDTDISNESAIEQNNNPIIIAEKATEIETMSVSQAVSRMDLLGLNSLLFTNGRHGGLNMVYIRPDGNIGWVDPQVN